MVSFYIFREVIPSTNGRREERVIEKICVSVDTTKIVRIPKMIICSILYKRR